MNLNIKEKNTRGIECGKGKCFMKRVYLSITVRKKFESQCYRRRSDLDQKISNKIKDKLINKKKKKKFFKAGRHLKYFAYFILQMRIVKS